MHLRGLSLRLLFLLLLFTGCERETAHVVVALRPQGLDPSTRWLFVQTQFGVRQTFVSNRFERPFSELDLQLPDNSVGEVSFTAEARDGFGMPVNHGSASVTLSGTGRYPLDLPLTADAKRTIVLRDDFDDGVLGTNSGGIGSGFFLVDAPYNGVSDKQAIEAGGTVTVTGGSLGKGILSKEAFDPTGMTLTAVIPQRPSGSSTDGGLNGGGIGWGMPTVPLCCDIAVSLGMHDGQMVFDLYPQQNFAPNDRYLLITPHMTTLNATVDTMPATDLIFSFYVDATTWKVDAFGPNMEVHQQGSYRAGVTLGDVLAAAGGKLYPTVGFGRQGGTGIVDSVLVTRP